MKTARFLLISIHRARIHFCIRWNCERNTFNNLHVQISYSFGRSEFSVAFEWKRVQRKRVQTE